MASLTEEFSRFSTTRFSFTLDAYVVPPPQPVTEFSTVINVCANIAGAGLLFLPLAMHQASIVTGAALICIFGAATVYTADLIIVGMELTGATNLPEVFAKLMVGPDSEDLTILEWEDRIKKRRRLSAMMDLMIAMYALCILAMYAQIIADSLVSVADALGAPAPWRSNVRYYGLLFFAALLPSAHRHLRELSFTSVLAVITLVIITIAMMVEYGYISTARGHVAHHGVRWFDLSPVAALSIPTLTVALGYHYNVPAMYREMDQPSPRKYHRATVTGTVFCVVLYIVVAVVGYLTFGPKVALDELGGNIMNNYLATDMFMTLVRAATAIHVFSVFPMTAISVRDAIHRLSLRAMGRHDEAEDPFIMLMTARNVVVMEAALVCAAGIISALYPFGSVGFFVNAIGTVFGVFVIFIAPGLMGMAIHGGMWRGSPVATALEGEYGDAFVPSESAGLICLAVVNAGALAVIVGLMGMFNMINSPM
jgi:amino acid permease